MRFAKYHGIGNDFVLIDRLAGGGPIAAPEAVRLCDRHRGVGADGVLTVLPSARATGRMHITNADGSVPQMCGNGLRCVAKHLADKAGVSSDEISVETDAGIRRCILRRLGGEVVEVTVDMGAPELEAARIPMRAGPGRFVQQPIEVGEHRLVGTAVSMGNPHLVLWGVAPELTAKLGPALEKHPLFPERTNVEFTVREGSGLSVTVWERGVGFTEACGSGACAAMVAAVLEERCPAGEELPVRLPGGTLSIRVEPDLSGVWMRGAAARVFTGEIELD